MIQLDYGTVTFMDWMGFIKLIQSGKTRNAISIIDKYIVGWDYKTDIKLGLKGLPNVLEVNRCLRHIMDYVEKRIEELDIKEVQVDLSSLTFDEYENWEKLRLNGSWLGVEKELHGMAKYKDSNVNIPLNCIDALLMIKAVVEVYQNSFLELP